MRGIDISNKVATINYNAMPPKISANKRSAESTGGNKQADENKTVVDVPKTKQVDVAEFVEKAVKDEKAQDNAQKQQTTQQTEKEMIEKANTKIKAINKKFEFSIHEATKQIVVKVKDSETDEILREIPSEKILDILANICEVAGLLVDEKR